MSAAQTPIAWGPKTEDRLLPPKGFFNLEAGEVSPTKSRSFKDVLAGSVNTTVLDANIEKDNIITDVNINEPSDPKLFISVDSMLKDFDSNIVDNAKLASTTSTDQILNDPTNDFASEEELISEGSDVACEEGEFIPPSNSEQNIEQEAQHLVSNDSPVAVQNVMKNAILSSNLPSSSTHDKIQSQNSGDENFTKVVRKFWNIDGIGITWDCYVNTFNAWVFLDVNGDLGNILDSCNIEFIWVGISMNQYMNVIFNSYFEVTELSPVLSFSGHLGILIFTPIGLKTELIAVIISFLFWVLASHRPVFCFIYFCNLSIRNHWLIGNVCADWLANKGSSLGGYEELDIHNLDQSLNGFMSAAGCNTGAGGYGDVWLGLEGLFVGKGRAVYRDFWQVFWLNMLGVVCYYYKRSRFLRKEFDRTAPIYPLSFGALIEAKASIPLALTLGSDQTRGGGRSSPSIPTLPVFAETKRPKPPSHPPLFLHGQGRTTPDLPLLFSPDACSRISPRRWHPFLPRLLMVRMAPVSPSSSHPISLLVRSHLQQRSSRRVASSRRTQTRSLVRLQPPTPSSRSSMLASVRTKPDLTPSLP
ncbi:hypothetical protein MA16_Dca007890 [Dendrobium catenatum]|uniref:Uncharacterized protein n=1 Tax=Dendrobium catenatum TaxID=906689 RepID=A0A2I0XJ64_9ASPA|nr:hypothetical protein MA16_Dca007890 [Dendrobium catenatum]